jgi:hypothetical protein
VWVSDGRLGRDARPAGQLPPSSQPAPVAAGPSAVGEPGPGGLPVSFRDALLGQSLAQPGMLVVHVVPFRLGAGLHSDGAHGHLRRWRRSC